MTARGGHRGHSRGGAYGAGSSSSSEDRGKGPDVIVVSGKGPMVHALVDVASSAELLSRLAVADDHAKPVTSTVDHARTSVIDVAAAAAEAKHICTVKRPYVTSRLKDIDRESTLFFSLLGHPVGSRATAHSHTTKSCMSGRHSHAVRRAQLGGLALGHVGPRMGVHPDRRSFERAITPGKPTTAYPCCLLMDERFGQVSRALEDGATGLEAFTVLLPVLSGHFDRVDSGAG